MVVRRAWHDLTLNDIQSDICADARMQGLCDERLDHRQTGPTYLCPAFPRRRPLIVGEIRATSPWPFPPPNPFLLHATPFLYNSSFSPSPVVGPVVARCSAAELTEDAWAVSSTGGTLA